jgi:lysophospholipase L1-like esterase
MPNKKYKMKKYKILLLLFFNSLWLISCQNVNTKKVSGMAFEQFPLANAEVRLLDANGKMLRGQTDTRGRYHFSIDGLTVPLLISVTQGNPRDCIKNSVLRPVCMAAYIDKFSPGLEKIANINPLTDRIVSDLAVMRGFRGPQQWIDSAVIGDVTSAQYEKALAQMRKGFENALKQLDIKQVTEFNPAQYSLHEHPKVAALLKLLHHNRNYDNNSGEAGHTTITDMNFVPVVGLFPGGDYEEFDLTRSNNQYRKIKDAQVRIFIVGDSTSAVYEKLRYPRMGWGQALAEKLSHHHQIAVVVGSRAGRSSRDFFNGRWFAQMESLIQKGDYVLINHGHNDQNCDSSKPLRGYADVENLCTYPNDTNGQPQFPDGKPEMSFQISLENYIQIVRKKLAHPILLTPTTRIKNADGQQSTPVVHSHLTKQNTSNGFLFVGDYTQTIRDTALKNHVPLIDLETASIEFTNSLNNEDWKNYWLAVDGEKYAFYENGVAGSKQLPDGTHFQKGGADKMAEIVLQLINENSELSTLANIIK